MRCRRWFGSEEAERRCWRERERKRERERERERERGGGRQIEGRGRIERRR